MITKSYGKRALQLPNGTRARAVPAREVEDIFGANLMVADQMGPGVPPPPTAIDGTGRGRQWQYRVGWNLPSVPGEGRIDFTTLRTVAQLYYLLRKCIEIRKNELARLPWKVTPRFGTPAEKLARLKHDRKKIRALQLFFDKPSQGRTWQDWMRELLEEHFVLDAVALEVRRNRGGKLIGLDVVAGDTIKPLIDVSGRTPEPPLPAYQQYLYGISRVDYTTDELLYRPQNIRASTPYGFSLVEQGLPVFNIAMRWMAWTNAVFTDGSIPQMLLSAPEGMSRDQIADLIEWRRAIKAGDPGAQRDLEMLPHGVEAILQNGAEGYLEYANEFVNWIIDQTALIMDVTRQELGLDPSNSNGLGGSGRADAQENVQYRRSLLPLATWFSANLFTPVLPEFDLSDYVWEWPTLTDLDPAAHADMLNKKLLSGQITWDEMRLELGQEPVGVSIPFLSVGNELLFPQDLLAMAKAGGAKAFEQQQTQETAARQSQLSQQEEEHKAQIAQQQAEHQAEVEQQSAAQKAEIDTNQLAREAGFRRGDAEHAAGLKRQEAEHAHQLALQQAEHASGLEQDAGDQQAERDTDARTHEATLTQGSEAYRNQLAQLLATHNSGLKQGEAAQAHSLDLEHADYQQGLDQENAAQQAGLGQLGAEHQQTLDRQSAEHQHTIDAQGRDLDHAHAIEQASHQAGLNESASDNQAAREYEREAFGASLKDDAATQEHLRTQDLAQIQGRLGEQQAQGNFTRQSRLADQNNSFALSQMAARAKFTQQAPRKKNQVSKVLQLDALPPTHGEFARAELLVKALPTPIADLLERNAYKLFVSGGEASSPDGPVATLVDEHAKAAFTFAGSTEMDLAQTLGELVDVATGRISRSAPFAELAHNYRQTPEQFFAAGFAGYLMAPHLQARMDPAVYATFDALTGALEHLHG